MKFFVFFACLSTALLTYRTSLAQTFTLEGTINADTGTVYLLTIADSSYYSYGQTYITAPVTGGHFTINGKIRYPSAFMIALFPKYRSSLFFVDPGVQTIVCHVDSMNEVPSIENASMEDWRRGYQFQVGVFEARYRHVLDKADSLRERYGSLSTDMNAHLDLERHYAVDQWDKAILRYVKTHRGSYIGLWEIINHLSGGYSPVRDSMYQYLSDSLKHTVTGQSLDKGLSSSRLTAIHHPFPKVTLLTPEGRSVQIPPTGTGSRYILVDFWFSHCGSCISQFPVLKKLYAQYRDSGFQIWGISTDAEQFIPDWKNVIQQQSLPWPQYLDKGGVLANKLWIVAFPSNFLLDKNGVIVAKNLTDAELEIFLKEALKQPVNNPADNPK